MNQAQNSPMSVDHSDQDTPDIQANPITGISAKELDLAQRLEYSSYRQLVERTIDVFGDELKASLWLSKPSPDLEGKVPLQIAESVQYAADELDRIFEPIFTRIEHGIYS